MKINVLVPDFYRGYEDELTIMLSGALRVSSEDIVVGVYKVYLSSTEAEIFQGALVLVTRNSPRHYLKALKGMGAHPIRYDSKRRKFQSWGKLP